MNGIGIFYEPEAYSTDTDMLMGRHAAGEGFMRAYAATRPDRAWCFSRTEAACAEMVRRLSAHGSPATRVDWVGLQSLSALETPGILYRPDPGIGEDAWAVWATPVLRLGASAALPIRQPITASPRRWPAC